MIPPIVIEMMNAVKDSSKQTKERIHSVKLGPIEDRKETFTFYLDNQKYKGIQEGSIRDAIIGLNEQADKSIAYLALIDGHCTKID